MLCALILYMSARTYSLKPTPNDRFFLRKFSCQSLFTLWALPAICWEEVDEEIFFQFDVRLGVWTRVLRIINQHTTYQTTMTKGLTIFIRTNWKRKDGFWHNSVLSYKLILPIIINVVMDDFLVINLLQQWFKQFTHVSCFFFNVKDLQFGLLFNHESSY